MIFEIFFAIMGNIGNMSKTGVNGIISTNENEEKIKEKKVPSAHLMSGMASTASGLARADISPVGWPMALALMTRRMILPLLVLGTSLTK